MAAPPVEQLWYLDTLLTIRVSNALGDDTTSLLEHQAPAGHLPQRHIHHTEDDIFHGLNRDLAFEGSAASIAGRRREPAC